MLLLASASPRRRDLLAQAGFSFRVDSIPVAEDRQPGEDPTHLAQRLAREKAEIVFQARTTTLDDPDDPLLVLGADTIVVCDAEVLGKPMDDADAFRMLRMLAGRTHQVITGVCLISLAGVEVASESTWVTMLTLSDEELHAYIATGEPAGKAGAYAIQGRASRWIPRIAGCYFNVVGLPLALVNTMIEAAHKNLLQPTMTHPHRAT
jgi:septum formation protein